MEEEEKEEVGGLNPCRRAAAANRVCFCMVLSTAMAEIKQDDELEKDDDDDCRVFSSFCALSFWVVVLTLEREAAR